MPMHRLQQPSVCCALYVSPLTAGAELCATPCLAGAANLSSPLSKSALRSSPIFSLLLCPVLRCPPLVLPLLWSRELPSFASSAQEGRGKWSQLDLGHDLNTDGEKYAQQRIKKINQLEQIRKTLRLAAREGNKGKKALSILCHYTRSGKGAPEHR